MKIVVNLFSDFYVLQMSCNHHLNLISIVYCLSQLLKGFITSLNLIIMFLVSVSTFKSTYYLSQLDNYASIISPNF